MRQMYLPTLAEMREMLGEDLYVKFIWMWREQEQDVRAQERRARLLGAYAQAAAAPLPSPMFSRAAPQEESKALPARTLAAALLRGPVSRVGELDSLVEQVRPRPLSVKEEDEPREALVVAGGGGRRRHR